MSRRRLDWGLGLAFLACLGVVGCSSASDSPSVDTRPTVENFAELGAKVVCSAVSTCCSAQQYSFDGNGCQAYSQRVLQDQPARVSSGKARWDSDAAQRCLDELSVVLGQCNTASPVTTADCAQIAVGVVATGEPCSDSRDCAAPPGQFASCVVELGSNGGTCKPPQPQVPVGGSCRLGEGCVPGAVCDFLLGKCVTPGADGASCTSDDGRTSGNCASGICDEKPLATQASCAMQ